MKNKIPTAEEFIKQYFDSKHPGLSSIRTATGIAVDEVKLIAISYAKLHVKAALEAAADNAELKAYPYNGCPECGRDDMDVDKNSILNAYPENLIV